MTVITSAFVAAARARGKVLGMPHHPFVVVEHPLASRTPEQVRAMAEAALEEVVRGLTQG